jgi:hypothetical protein
MWNAQNAADLVEDYRYALEVLEENSHLGLDHEFASSLRDTLLRRIDEAEAVLSRYPAAPAREPRKALRLVS